MYTELMEKIERMFKFVYFVFLRVSFYSSIVAPPLTTLSNFFILNLGDESYEPMQMVYVNTHNSYAQFFC